MPREQPPLVVVDVETTGFRRSDRVVDVAAVRLHPETGEIVDEYDTLVQPGRDVGHSSIHGITPSMLELAPAFEEIVGDFARRLHGRVLVAHNLPFDRRFLQREFDRCGVRLDPGAGICTLSGPWRKSGEPPSARSADRGGVRGGGGPLPAIDGGGNRAAIRAAGPWEERPAAKRNADLAPSRRGVDGGALFPRAVSATGQRLTAACDDHGVPLDCAHRALADARATAGLLARLGLDRPDDRCEPVRIGYIDRRPTKRTLRRDLADPEAPAMPRVVSRAHYPHCDEAVSLYLDALDHVLDDGVLDDEERDEMRRLAEECGIPEEVRQRAHREYFDAVVDAAKRDGVITPREREVIENLARQLGIPDAERPSITRLPEITVLRAGSRVCFTGRVVLGGIPWERDRLEALAVGRGFRVTAGVTRRGCDLLVAADAASVSGKARAARRLGIPIWSAAEFRERSR